MKRAAERVLPHNLEAERAVLGAILIQPEIHDVVAPVITSAAFFRDAHRRIFQGLTTLRDRQVEIDLVTLRDEMERRGELDEVGGPTYLAALVDAIPHASSARAYAEIVADKALLRNVIQKGNTIVGRAYEADEPAVDILKWSEQQLCDLTSGRGGALVDLRHTAAALSADLAMRVERRGQVTGVDTGFDSINALTLGWQPGDLVVLAARPSIGKTTFVINSATAAARAGRRVAIFSLEMRREQLEYRMLSSLSGVGLTRMLHGALGQLDYAKISDAMEVLTELPVWIDDTASRTVWDIRAACRELRSHPGLDLVVIDYIQLMQGSSERRNATRQEEVADISRRLKILAGELNVPILVLSQLSRAGEGRSDPRPKLSDLRESGALEQDADIVGFLHRKDHRAGGVTSFIMEKQRNGATGAVNLTLDRDLVMFTDGGDEPAPDPDPPAKPVRAKAPARLRY